MGRFICTSVLLIFGFSYANSVDTVNGRVKITVGITAGNLEAENFIRNQVVPTYNHYKDFVDFEFVPWGRTVRQPDGALACEYGEHDCWANRLQRCVLNHVKGNAQAAVNYMACEYAQPFPAYRLGNYRCAVAAGMRVIEADFCVNNPSTDTLDRDAEAAALLPMTEIETVPYVYFNGKIDAQDSAQARQRMSSMVCFALAHDPSSGIRACQI